MTAPGGYSGDSFSGSFFDGRTARAHEVVADCGAGGLRIRQPGGAVLALWPAEDVRLATGHRAGEALRLRCGQSDEARLTIAADTARTTLERYCPNLNRSPDRLRDQWRPILLWGGGAVASILFLVLVGLPWLATIVAQSIPAETEAKWGDEIVEPMAGLISRIMGGAPSRNIAKHRPAVPRSTVWLRA